MICKTSKRLTSQFVILSNHVANDPRLTAESLALYFFMMTKSHNFQARKTHIQKRFDWKRSGWEKAIKPLLMSGYAELIPVRGKGGQMTGSEYIFYDTPQTDRDVDRQHVGTDRDVVSRTFGQTPSIKSNNLKSSLHSDLSTTKEPPLIPHNRENKNNENEMAFLNEEGPVKKIAEAWKKKEEEKICAKKEEEKPQADQPTAGNIFEDLDHSESFGDHPDTMTAEDQDQFMKTFRASSLGAVLFLLKTLKPVGDDTFTRIWGQLPDYDKEVISQHLPRYVVYQQKRASFINYVRRKIYLQAPQDYRITTQTPNGKQQPGDYISQYVEKHVKGGSGDKKQAEQWIRTYATDAALYGSRMFENMSDHEKAEIESKLGMSFEKGKEFLLGLSEKVSS